MSVTAEWLRIVQKPTTLYVDKGGAVKLAKNPEYHRKLKHISSTEA